ncbi:hypothetical protein WJX81_006955 [Elliptochloris bilobata]|uniref:Uncharacterized protein n=1 Tax=Elliptochloris bilobata TaxID=381761 RepID=A0AAW1RLY3_9CHLO
MKPPGRRLHGYLTTAIVTTAMVAYYSMASRGGDTTVRLYWNQTQARDIFYARYIDWFITTPMLLLDLLLLSSVPVGTVLWVIVADIFMIVLGLMGALSNYGYRWGWFGIGCLFQIFIVAGLISTGMKSAYARSNELGKLYTTMSMFILVLWWGYPIVWGLAEGSNTISVKAEIACYGCLDVCTKVIFGYILMSSYSIIERVHTAEETDGKMAGNILSSPIQAPLGAILGGGKDTARAVPMTGPPLESTPVPSPDARRAGVNNV